MPTDILSPEAPPTDVTQTQQPAQQVQPAQQGQPQAGQTEVGQQQVEDYKLDIPLDGNEPADIAVYEQNTKALAKELGLSKEAAQKLVNRDIALRVEGQKRIDAAIDQQKTRWAEQTRSDTEVGGQNLDRSLGDARTVLDKFGTPAFKKEITESGYGNNVELIRLLARVGKVMREDGIVQAQQPARDSRRIADLMYPSMSAQQES
jgi:hypothetical protein